MDALRSARFASSRYRARRASASRGCSGSSRSTSTASSPGSTGTAGAACPTVMASPTGRSPRSFAAGWGSARVMLPKRRSNACARGCCASSTRPRTADGSSRGSRRCSAWATPPSRAPAPRRSFPRGACSSNVSLPRIPLFSWSRTCTGPTRACSISSTTCWSGRGAIRSLWSRWPDPSWTSDIPNGTGSGATPRLSTSNRSTPNAMHALVDGVAPQLPPAARAAVLERAEGIPLYAVETLRMLVDQGVLVGGEEHYELVASGAGEEAVTIDIPASLQALVSARLDSLDAEERRTVQDAAVLGLAFSGEDVAVVAGARGRAPDETKMLLQALVRRDILGVETGPPSYEHGHYRFVQSVMRTVAYDSMSRRDRKARHLAVAAHFARLTDADELSPVIARHYLDAAAAVPDAPDADGLRALARERLLRAAERAGSLGATFESIAHYETLIGLLPTGDELAGIAERAAEAALRGARYELALQYVALARESISHLDARSAARLGHARRQYPHRSRTATEGPRHDATSICRPRRCTGRAGDRATGRHHRDGPLATWR